MLWQKVAPIHRALEVEVGEQGRATSHSLQSARPLRSRLFSGPPRPMVLISRRARDVGLCIVCAVLFTTLFRVLRPRNNRPNIAPGATSEPAPAPPPSPHLLLSSISGMPIANVSHFLKSAREAGPASMKIVVFADADHLTKALRGVATQWNITLEPRILSAPAGSGVAAWRFAEFHRWLSAYEVTARTEAAWVLMVDARNLTVQRSVFGSTPPARAPVSMFALADTLRTDAAAARAVEACAGRTSERWANETVLTSVAVLASYQAAKAYAALMQQTMQQTTAGAVCTEEGAHMALAFNQSIPQVLVWPPENPLVYTVLPREAPKHNAAGEVLTPKGLVPCVVALR